MSDHAYENEKLKLRIKELEAQLARQNTGQVPQHIDNPPDPGGTASGLGLTACVEGDDASN